MARLSISLLGPLQVTLDGQPIASFGSDKARALLAYLAAEAHDPNGHLQRTHPRETLAGLLWPNYPERSARNSLRNALSLLRKAIGDHTAVPPHLLIDRDAIQFNRASDYWLDLATFWALDASEGQEPPDVRRLEEAIALHRGGFLQGFSIRDSAAYEDWMRLTRECLQRRVLSILERLTACLQRRGEHGRACEYAWRQVELEPWREDAHRQLMRLLALSGRRAAGLAQYEACKRALKEELDVAPGDETHRLYQRIRDGIVGPRQAMFRRQAVVPTPVEVAAPTTAATALSRPGSHGAERRRATVLYAEVSGSAALLDDLGPAAWTVRMRDVLQTLTSQVARFGGQVAERRQDGLTAIFGVPVAHEDHAERAVLAALAMRDAVQHAPGLRVGVDTGEVLVTYRGDEWQAVGRALALAHRASLGASTHARAVAVGENAYHLVRPLFEWATDARSDGGHRPLTHVGIANKGRGIPGLSSPLVGRDREVRALREAVERLQLGIGGVVTLVGEAGIGKSRLVAEVRQRVRERDGLSRSPPESLSAGVQWVEGRCLSYMSNVAYHPWLDLLRQLASIAPDASPVSARDILRQWVRAVCPDRYGEMYPYLCRLMSLPLEDGYEAVRGLDGESLRAEVFRAVASLVECAARQRPLVVACEDLHWADPTSLALLDRALPLIESVPLLLLCTFRPDTVHGCWRFKETAARQYRHRYTDLELGPLSATESATLVRHLLRVEDLSGVLKTRILDRAQGNPLYAEEIVRTLIDSGALLRDEASGGWRVPAKVVDVQLPETLHGLLAARIDRLPAQAKRTLQRASVIGRVLSHRLLAEISPPAAALSSLLLTLEREQLIREQVQVPEREYVFQHVLTQEAAYGSLLKGERQRVHRQVAEALERLYAQRIEEHLGLLAHHWERAGKATEAVEYLLRAGEQARGAYANEEAMGYYRRAMALLEGSPLAGSRKDWLLTILKGLGIVCLHIGRLNEAEQPLQQAIAVGTEIGLPAQELAHISYWLGEAYRWLARYDEMNDVGQQRLALLREQAAAECGDAAAADAWFETALMNYLLAEAQFDLGKTGQYIRRIRPYLDRLPYVEELRAVYASVCHWCVWWEKDADEGRRWIRALQEKAAACRDLRGLTTAYRQAGTLLFESGDFHGMLEASERALELYRRIGDATHAVGCLSFSGFALEFLGRLAEAHEYEQQTLERALALGSKAEVADAYWRLGMNHLYQKKADLAVQTFHKAIGLWEEIGDQASVAWDSYFLGRAFLARGQRAQALPCFQRAISGIGWTSRSIHEFPTHVLSGLEDAYQDPEEFRAFCRRFRHEHPEAITGWSSTHWFGVGRETSSGESAPFVQWCLEPAQLGRLCASTQADASLTRDEFSDDLSPAWTWHDPFGDCSFAVGKGLEIYAANGRDLRLLNLSAPRLLRPARGDLVIQAACMSVSEERPAIGGLVLWKDEHDYLFLRRGRCGKREVAFQGRVGQCDILIGRGQLPAAPGSRIWLRLERRGARVEAFCRAADGGDAVPDLPSRGEGWFAVGHVQFPVESAIHVGLYGSGGIERVIYPGEHANGAAIRFDSFQLWQRDVAV